MDINGKSTIVDPVDGRPIMIGDGIIPQVERFASKYAYGKLTVSVLNTVLSMMNEKAENPTGNQYMFICNEKFYQELTDALGAYLAQFHTDGTYLYSMKAGGTVEVNGGHFNSYNYLGNQLTFKVDRTFSREYGYTTGYCLCLDLTSDSTSNQPPIGMFTLKGGDFIQNKIPGVGSFDGLSSGVVSSPVAGSHLVIWGYAGVGVFNPYRSFILRGLENE